MNNPINSNLKDIKNPTYANSMTSDYLVNRLHSASKKNEQIGDHYGDSKKDNSQQNDLSSSQGTLYSVSQRVPTVNSSYSNLCPTNSGYDQKNYQNSSSEWERERTVSMEVPKENSSDGLSDKQTNGSNTTASVPSLVISNGSVNSSNSESLQGPVIPICAYLHNKTAVMMEIDDTPSATSEVICQALTSSDELGLNKQLALQVFSLWMISPLVELQLKPSQKPYSIRKAWRSLVEHYSHATYNRQQRDEPKMMYQRNVYFPLTLEEKIKDPKIIELLYEEAKNNIINGRYPCEPAHYIMLGGVQAHIELGPCNPQIHTVHYFREEQHRYLPPHVRRSSTWTWLSISHKNSPEVRLLEHYKRVPPAATNRKLMKKYLEFCWTLPFYGAAFFEGQIEQPVKGLASLITFHDIPVLIAINSTSVYVIDDIECTVLLGVRYEDMNWEYARPNKEDDPNCLPCLFLQFPQFENGIQVSKVLQVFSRQANLMDALILHFYGKARSKSGAEFDQKIHNEFQVDSSRDTPDIPNSPNPTVSSLSNKLERLTLATFDEDGNCIGQTGSWSFSY